jgi:transcriptional regulator with XRE-family HTH domain
VSTDPDLLLSKIGLRILRRRQEFGLTQKELAGRLGITTTNIARIEHGQQNLTIRTLAKLADALDVTLEELVTGRAADVEQEDGKTGSKA